jgi:hypothetical protein
MAIAPEAHHQSWECSLDDKEHDKQPPYKTSDGTPSPNKKALHVCLSFP